MARFKLTDRARRRSRQRGSRRTAVGAAAPRATAPQARPRRLRNPGFSAGSSRGHTTAVPTTSAPGAYAGLQCPPGQHWYWLPTVPGTPHTEGHCVADTSAGEVTPSNYWYDVPMDRSRQRAGRRAGVGAAAPRRSPGFTAGSSRGYTAPATTAAGEAGGAAVQALGIGELPPAPGTFEPEIAWVCVDQDGKHYRC